MVTFRKPEVTQFFRTFGIQQFAVNQDESQLVFSTNISGKYNLWAMDLPNQFPYPLTFNDQSCQSVFYDKQNRYIVAGFDQDGDENSQLYAVPTSGGPLEPLRIAEGQRHMNPFFSEDGRYLYYTSTKENGMYLNTYKYDVEADEEALIHVGDKGATYLVAASADGQSLAFLQHFANTYMPAFIKCGDTIKSLTPPSDKQFTVGDIVFTSNNMVYFTTNFEADFSYLARYNIEQDSFEKVLDLNTEDITMLKYTKDENILYIVACKGVEDILYRFDVTTNEYIKIDTPLASIEQLKIAKSGAIYILGRSATKPFNIFRMQKDNSEWQALTNYGVPGVQESDLCEPDVLQYPSFDGLKIEALFFKAKEDVSNGHVILWPHGGPQAAERKSFRAMFQFLINRGYSIFAPNFRGSDGYGLAFKKMVEGDWGHGPRLDNIEGLEYLIKKGYVDRDKILLMGGSYGGYMALLLHGRHADYFKAVVDIFGPSDLFSFINSVPEHWKPAMAQWVGDPIRDKEKLIEYSPITYLDGMTKPMLVIQGAKDPRVVKEESDQIVEALREKGSEVEYIVFDDEGHGFSKKENEIKVYQSIMEFFDRFI
ncbi:S9 family peptidase [Bacillus sp. HMF5848]|uniref:S9 family peptidase n=1 Tax=Bacillus sp. HMF5848 TaxID=2495421 RepID=UPI000F7B151D|nr:S9 family peptidase [Bacillus sp. HMF5848]RSK26809.1 S9 family peptidase [Bacillus sp. HMF5848]